MCYRRQGQNHAASAQRHPWVVSFVTYHEGREIERSEFVNPDLQTAMRCIVRQHRLGARNIAELAEFRQTDLLDGRTLKVLRERI